MMFVKSLDMQALEPRDKLTNAENMLLYVCERISFKKNNWYKKLNILEKYSHIRYDLNRENFGLCTSDVNS